MSSAAEAPPAYLPKDTHFGALDALRGVFALIVAVYHFPTHSHVFYSPIVQNAYLVLDFFFVLSGFVITHSYGAHLSEGRMSVWRYMGLRLGRIYPLHLAVLLAFLALELVLLVAGEWFGAVTTRTAFSPPRELWSFIQSLFLIQSFGIPGGDGWNVPAWSISAEVWTYFVFAFVLALAIRARIAVSLIISVAALLAIMAIAQTMFITLNGGVLRALCGFGIGIALYHLYVRHGEQAWGGTVSEVVVSALALALLIYGQSQISFAAPIVFALFIFVLAAERGAISWVLTRPALLYLGTISYSIYMVHTFVQARLADLLAASGLMRLPTDLVTLQSFTLSPLASDALTTGMLALVVFVSHFVYHGVEKAGRDWSRRLLRPADPGFKKERA